MVWHPSGDTPFFVLINSTHGSSPDHHQTAPWTVSNTGGPWVAIFSSFGGSGLSKVTLDEPELESWLVNEVIRPELGSLSWIFTLLLNSSI